MVRDTASKESIRCWSVAREKLPSNRKRTNQCVRFMTGAALVMDGGQTAL